jgi:hypothetical protein
MLFILVLINMAFNLLWEGIMVNIVVKRMTEKQKNVVLEGKKAKMPEMNSPNWKIPAVVVLGKSR